MMTSSQDTGLTKGIIRSKTENIPKSLPQCKHKNRPDPIFLFIVRWSLYERNSGEVGEIDADLR